jgi:hypothetical protein
LKFFVCFYTWSEEDKIALRSLIETAIEDDKSDVGFGSLMIFGSMWSSKSDGLFVIWQGLLSLMISTEFDEANLKLLRGILFF